LNIFIFMKKMQQIARQLFIGFLIISLSGNLSYAANFETADEDTVRVGLVLSGGGALGIAHIGVIETLEEAGVRIDYITGTSMGSLVGGLYSIGYTSEQLYEIATSSNFIELFTDRRDRRFITNYEKVIEDRTIASFPISERRIDLPIGIISGQNIYTFLSRLTWNVHGTEDFNRFPIPFAAIGADIETGKAHVFREGYLPDALRASISIPSVFAPHQIGDKVYVDGGVIRNLPVQDAIDMGATYTIAVDVSTPLLPVDSLRTLSDIFTQTMMYRVHDYSDIEKELADYVIEFEELIPFTPADFDQAELFIEIGRREAQKHLEKFKEIASMQSTPPPPRPGVGEPGALPVTHIKIEGNTIFDDEFILRLLDFTPGTSLNPEIIEEKVTKLYSSQYINKVTYRIQPNDDYYYTLLIKVEENIRDEFRVGLRYESYTQASILLEGTFQNLLYNGSLTRAEIRLGDLMNYKLDHAYFGAFGSQLALLTSMEYVSENVDWFTDGERVSRFKNEVLRGEISGGNYFSTQNLISAGIRKDFTFHSNKINKEAIGASEKDYHAFFVRLMRDNLNRRSYATSGEKLIMEGFLSDELFLSPLNFFSAKFYYKGLYPVTDYLSLTNSFWVGYTRGDELPWHYWNSPNRFDPLFGHIIFGGSERYKLTSRNVQMASAGFQLEPFYHRFIGLEMHAGRFLNEWNLNLNENDVDYGVSLTVGAQTILGPIKAIFSHSTLTNFNAELQIGYQF